MTGRPLRIVHVVSSLRIGGMEQFVVRLAEAQRRNGHEASVLAIAGGALEAEASRRSVPVRVVGHRLMPVRVIAACAHFAAAQPDIVHVHNPTSLHYGVLAGYTGRPRIAFTDHAQGRGLVRVPPAREWKRVDVFASVSAHTATQAAAIGYHGKVTVVYNGVDRAEPTADRAGLRASLGLDDRVGVLNVASFDPVKGHDILLRAAALLRDRAVPACIVCVGDGPERQAIEAQSREYRLGPSEVQFLGFRRDVDCLLGAADLFMLPSRSEGLPMSVLEAMSHGVPPICTNVGGSPELVEHERNGLVVPADDPVSLAAAIERLAVDAVLRATLGAAARARATEAFSFARTSSGYDHLYRVAMREVSA